MTVSFLKHSYTIPCASAFRDAIEALAAKRRVNVGDLARSVLLVVPAGEIQAFPDPGEPEAEDRETVVLKSGPAEGRPWRRKPRLQVRMPQGYKVEFIRKALGVALAMDRGELAVSLGRSAPVPQDYTPQRLPEHLEEMERMRAIISVLAFEPLAEGPRNRAEALHVLGFPPSANPDMRKVRAKFRMLATIHHPDSNYGSHARMSQLNKAMEILKRAS
ncbi:J domain-containing protein [Telmatospirillum sp. J64-1]|uniref:J domain-containing protein n=1 Tax=Telmatospirillum sp. J64-1 TaxID=2502183 RepID=UPI00115E512F|nr:J domain-containing protein [Telmatospirillum sp. J64-1]